MFKIICVIVASFSLAACQDDQSIIPQNKTNQVNVSKVSADPPVVTGNGSPH